MSICILDTSVFCNILAVPGRDIQREETLRLLARLADQGAIFLLPVVTLYETGSHIARLPDGEQRREAAERLARQARAAFSGDAPWIPTPLREADTMVDWLAEFSDQAGRGLGLADLAIIKIFHEQRALHPSRRVFIWSYDRHLQGYDHEP